MSYVILVHTVFSAIQILEEMNFVRQGYDREHGKIEWRNSQWDSAEIIFDKQLNCCKIDIYYFRNGFNNGGRKMNGKEPTPQEEAHQENVDKEFERLINVIDETKENQDEPSGQDSNWPSGPSE